MKQPIDPLFLQREEQQYKKHYLKSPLFLLSPEKENITPPPIIKQSRSKPLGSHKRKDFIANERLVSSIPLYDTIQKYKKYLQPSSHALYVRLIYVQHLFFQANQAFRQAKSEQLALEYKVDSHKKQMELKDDLMFQKTMNDWYTEQMETRMEKVHQLIEALNEENQMDKQKIHEQHRQDIVSLQHEIAYLQQKLRHEPFQKEINFQSPYPITPPTPTFKKTSSPMVIQAKRKKNRMFSQSKRIRKNLTSETNNLLSSPDVYHLTSIMKPM
mmetsp:Transcript_7599/g.11282  ORF Transcript_7599/g.11282 Transcript_7599/m.11282 type:complete len:271 (-) Transcript_7599:25-837(-)